MLAEFGDDLLRLKGIVRLLDEPALQVVQAEPGLPVEFTALPTRAGDEPATGTPARATRSAPEADSPSDIPATGWWVIPAAKVRLPRNRLEPEPFQVQSGGRDEREHHDNTTRC